jgi:DNA repair exonuclease SbcCD ATPase subunit
MKVTVKDFLILQGEQTFEFPIGLTVVVGASASGKSSVFYAIQNALSNPSGVADCINHNADKAVITLENNGNVITWVKTKTSSEYINELTKQQYVKASKLDSRDIADLGFYFNNKDKIVNIHDEWSVLFPFGESDADTFKLFEDIFNISCSVQVIDEMKKEESSAKSLISSTQNEIDEIKAKQLILDNILSSSLNKETVSKKVEELNNINLYNANIIKAFQTYQDNQYISNLIKVPTDFNYDLDAITRYNFKINDDYKKLLKFEEHSKISIVLDDFVFEPTNYQNILNDFNKCNYIQSDISNFSKQIMELDNKIHELEIMLSTIKVCPVCGKPMEN